MKLNERIKVVTAFGFSTEAEALKKAEALGEKYPESKGWRKTSLGVEFNQSTRRWHAKACFKREENDNN